MKNNNKYQYEINNGIVKGHFKIYQAINGKIYLQLGDRVTDLTIKQINELKIDVYNLIDFNHSDFKKAYNLLEDKK